MSGLPLLLQRWTTEQEITLISFYREHNCLWEPDHPDYFKKYVREACLKRVAKLLGTGITVGHVKEKIRNLRTVFSREYRRTKLSGSDCRPSRWVHFKRLSFLKDIIMKGSVERRRFYLNRSSNVYPADFLQQQQQQQQQGDVVQHQDHVAGGSGSGPADLGPARDDVVIIDEVETDTGDSGGPADFACFVDPAELLVTSNKGTKREMNEGLRSNCSAATARNGGARSSDKVQAESSGYYAPDGQGATAGTGMEVVPVPEFIFEAEDETLPPVPRVGDMAEEPVEHQTRDSSGGGSCQPATAPPDVSNDVHPVMLHKREDLDDTYCGGAAVVVQPDLPLQQIPQSLAHKQQQQQQQRRPSPPDRTSTACSPLDTEASNGSSGVHPPPPYVHFGARSGGTRQGSGGQDLLRSVRPSQPQSNFRPVGPGHQEVQQHQQQAWDPSSSHAVPCWTASNDAESLFGQFVTATLRSIVPDYRRDLAKLEIQQVLIKHKHSLDMSAQNLQVQPSSTSGIS